MPKNSRLNSRTAGILRRRLVRLGLCRQPRSRSPTAEFGALCVTDHPTLAIQAMCCWGKSKPSCTGRFRFRVFGMGTPRGRAREPHGYVSTYHRAVSRTAQSLLGALGKALVVPGGPQQRFLGVSIRHRFGKHAHFLRGLADAQGHWARSSVIAPVELR